MDHRLNAVLGEQFFHQCLIADVAMYKAECRLSLDAGETGAVAGIGQCIEFEHEIARVTAHPVVYEVRADADGDACYEQLMAELLTHAQAPPASVAMRHASAAVAARNRRSRALCRA